MVTLVSVWSVVCVIIIIMWMYVVSVCPVDVYSICVSYGWPVDVYIMWMSSGCV